MLSVFYQDAETNFHFAPNITIIVNAVVQELVHSPSTIRNGVRIDLVDIISAGDATPIALTAFVQPKLIKS